MDSERGRHGGSAVLFWWPAASLPPGFRRRCGVAALGFRGVVWSVVWETKKRGREMRGGKGFRSLVY